MHLQAKKEDIVPEKSLSEKFLEEKRNAQNMSGNQFGKWNSSFNHPWFGVKSGWGRPTIRKHAARSR